MVSVLNAIPCIYMILKTAICKAIMEDLINVWYTPTISFSAIVQSCYQCSTTTISQDLDPLIFQAVYIFVIVLSLFLSLSFFSSSSPFFAYIKSTLCQKCVCNPEVCMSTTSSSRKQTPRSAGPSQPRRRASALASTTGPWQTAAAHALPWMKSILQQAWKRETYHSPSYLICAPQTNPTMRMLSYRHPPPVPPWITILITRKHSAESGTAWCRHLPSKMLWLQPTQQHPLCTLAIAGNRHLPPQSSICWTMISSSWYPLIKWTRPKRP